LVEEKVAVQISKSLHDKVLSEVKKSRGEFNSVGGYVEFVLREFFKEKSDEETYTREEEDLIKKRLRSLGYI
jgi:Arc/MetJ-type ribon-helix-helix transcriptional regulator